MTLHILFDIVLDTIRNIIVITTLETFLDVYQNEKPTDESLINRVMIKTTRFQVTIVSKTLA